MVQVNTRMVIYNNTYTTFEYGIKTIEILQASVTILALENILKCIVWTIITTRITQIAILESFQMHFDRGEDINL